MDTPDFFVGARLGAARVKAGISIEQATQDMKISMRRLGKLELDDFSDFPHPTYTRLFLLDYGKYLGVPQDEIHPLLPAQTGAAPGRFQYIDALAAEHLVTTELTSQRRFRILTFLVAIGLLLCLLAAGLFAYFTFRKIERVARSKPLEVLVTPSEATSEPPLMTSTVETFPPDHAAIDSLETNAPTKENTTSQ